MKQLQIFGLLLSFIFVSCQTKQLADNQQTAQEIIHEIGGMTGTFGFAELKSSIPSTNKKYISLDVDSCVFLKDSIAEKFILASYCATQLYNRLDPEMMTKYDGINIVFDREDDIDNPFKYYFEKKELVQAWKAFDIIDAYLNYCKNENLVTASTFVDTNYFAFNLDSTNLAVSNLCRKAKNISKHTYSHFDYINKAGNKNILCFDIITRITKSDNTEVDILFTNPVFEENNKIIGIFLDE